MSVCRSRNAVDALDLPASTPGETLSGLVIIGWYRNKCLCWSTHILRDVSEQHELSVTLVMKLWCLLFGLRAGYEAPDGGSCK